VTAFERTTYWERAEAAFRANTEHPATNLLAALGLSDGKYSQVLWRACLGAA
jgi:hypothetical protein